MCSKMPAAEVMLTHLSTPCCGSYSVQLVQPVVHNVWLQNASSKVQGWSSALPSFSAGVNASIPEGSFVDNTAAYVLLARGDAGVSVAASVFNGSAGTAAAAMDGSKLFVASSVLESNHAHARGGAFLIGGSATVSINNSTLRNNSGQEGPDMTAYGATTVSINNSWVTNHQGAFGVAEVSDSAVVLINNSLFKSNSAPLRVNVNDNGYGGVVKMDQASSAWISNSGFISNSAGFGGVVFMEAKNLTVSDCEFTLSSGFHGGVAHIKGDTQVSAGNASKLCACGMGRTVIRDRYYQFSVWCASLFVAKCCSTHGQLAQATALSACLLRWLTRLTV
jgi:hypothetical protein